MCECEHKSFQKLGKILWRGNKMIVYMRKIKQITFRVNMEYLEGSYLI